MADFSADYNKIIEENRIKHGDNFPKIMGGSVEKLDVKEVLYGNQYRTWIIVIADDDKVYTMKFIYGSYVKYHPMFL